MADRLTRGTSITERIQAQCLQLPVEAKGANFSVTEADSGRTFLLTAANVVASLPPTQAGLKFTFIVVAPSGAAGAAVSPAAADRINGNGFTAADNKDAINTGATDAIGDLIEVIGDGDTGWYITNIIGTWARQA